MKVGDVIVVEGFRARDGSNNGSGGTVTFADGRRVFTASKRIRCRKATEDPWLLAIASDPPARLNVRLQEQ